ncbi:MAG: hypothetical protein HS115_02925 [Spirochaetales bacterium]|nr:hypothetical protein [Spirochaetales bacterium]
MKEQRGRIISILLFILGISALIGADTYKDFFFEMQAKISGSGINYQALAEFCGWTGAKKPGETDTERGIRAAWNMGSAMMGMSALAVLLFLLVAGIIFGLFYITGNFR